MSYILIIDRPWPFVIEIIRNFTGIKETMTVKLIYDSFLSRRRVNYREGGDKGCLLYKSPKFIKMFYLLASQLWGF